MQTVHLSPHKFAQYPHTLPPNTPQMTVMFAFHHRAQLFHLPVRVDITVSTPRQKTRNVLEFGAAAMRPPSLLLRRVSSSNIQTISSK